MSKVKELINSNVVTLFHDYRWGHANDLSKNANHGVLNGTKKFINGGIIDPGITGYVSVPTNPLIFTPNFSCFIVCKWFPQKTISNSIARLILYERATTGTYFYLDSTGGARGIYIFKSVPYSTSYIIASKPFTTTKCLGFTYTSGSKPKLYIDGVYDGVFGNNWITEGGVVSELKILGKTVLEPFNPLVQSLFCTNTQLSDTDVAQVTSELIRQEY